MTLPLLWQNTNECAEEDIVSNITSLFLVPSSALPAWIIYTDWATRISLIHNYPQVTKCNSDNDDNLLLPSVIFLLLMVMNLHFLSLLLLHLHSIKKSGTVICSIFWVWNPGTVLNSCSWEQYNFLIPQLSLTPTKTVPWWLQFCSLDSALS